MKGIRHGVSSECIERFYVWLKVHCPCSLEDDEFMKGLLVITEEEVIRALVKERRRMYREISRPSQQ